MKRGFLMLKKLIVPCVILSAAFAQAGIRESFDFDWTFKYFGDSDPSAGPAKASSTQAGHPAGDAIDGDSATRWTAANHKPGHSLTIATGFSDKVKTLEIEWENALPKSAVIDIAGPKRKKINLSVKEATSTVDLGGLVVSAVRITVNGTAMNNWASIREVVFKDAQGRVLKPVSAKGINPKDVAYVEKGFKPVQLPHDWAIESPFLSNEPNETGKLPWNGIGWYRKTFDVPQTFAPAVDRWYLDFDGVMMCPKVYVNGELAGEWAYGYSSFRVDLTPYLKAGQKNLIAVEASNRPLSTRWYPGAGIYRHVWLEKVGPVHLAQWGVKVTTPTITDDSATVTVETTIDNTGDKALTITVMQNVGAIAAPGETLTIAPYSSETVKQSLVLQKPTRWSCETPHLYSLTTSVFAADGARLDTAKTSFGVRTIEWKEDGFYLNGKKVRLNGVCEHHDLGALGSAFYARGYERKIEILKKMGCNSIRMTHNPPAPEVLDLCDKHGILVIDELFDIWKHQKYEKVNGYHIYWPKWWKKDVSNFVRRDRNHPSIIAWSGGNEISEITTKDGPAINRDLRSEFRKYDTTRPYTVGVNAPSGAWNGFGAELDVYGYNYKPSHYKAFRDKHMPGMPFYGSETGSCVATRDTYFFPVKWGVGDGFRAFQVSAYGLYAPGWAYCPDAEFTAQDQVPEVAGEYVWTGFDYLGEPTPYNQDSSNANNFHGVSEAEKKAAMAAMAAMGNRAPSRSSYFGIIDLAGFPKDTYYLYQSRWLPDLKQAHILPHWNWKGREGETTPVMVFSSGDEAELFLNGKSQGVRRKGEGGTFNQAGMTISKNGHRFTWEDVKYAPGELKVVVKKNGKPWATATRVTTGNAVSVKADIDRTSLSNEGHDLAFIELATVDAKGNVVPTDCRKVSFSVSGPATLVGFCNGNPIDQTCMQNPKQEFFNGRILAIVRGDRGKSGDAVVTIRPEGLNPVKVTIAVGK